MAENLAPVFDCNVFLFHGGGALGAYQAGVFKGLHESGYSAHWIIGTSIGAVTGAIIAGNTPDAQVKKLQEFWESVATRIPAAPDTLNNILLERFQHYLSATYTELHGQPGFFVPRFVNPWFGIQSTPDKLSFYDSGELRETLQRLINFDLINEKKVRLSMGSVHIETGDLAYFDNTKIEINVDHVMASCALPPGLPAVRIDNHFYWDGGVHSNNQINLLLREQETDDRNYLCFMVHLFNSYGIRPVNMDDVLKRQKDINYSSHHKQSIIIYRQNHNLRHAIKTLGEHIPEEKREDPQLEKLINLGRSGIIYVTRFHCRGKLSDLSSKDYEFSWSSIQEHISNGCDDVNKAMADPPWKRACPRDTGLVLYEISDLPVVEENAFEEPANYHCLS